MQSQNLNLVQSRPLLGVDCPSGEKHGDTRGHEEQAASAIANRTMDSVVHVIDSGGGARASSNTSNSSLSGSGMEVTHRKRPSPAAQAARESIVNLWLELDRPPVDAHLLEAVQLHLAKSDDDPGISPASVARLLADEGAELRHPEIIESDVRWRESRVNSRMDKFAAVEPLSTGARLNIQDAGVLISKMEKLRQELEREADKIRLDELRKLAAEARQRAEAMGKNRKLNETVRCEQSEIAEWLKVWLQTPALFENWLELRRRSEEFRRRFDVNAP